MRQTHETPYLTYEIIEPRLLKAIYRAGLPPIDLPMAMDIVSDRLQRFGEAEFYLLVEEPGTTRFLPETWEYLVTAGTVGLKCIAIVAENNDTFVTGSFFLASMPTDIPVRMFETEADALTWLRESMKK